MFVHISRAKRDGPILAKLPAFVHLTQTGSTRTYFYHVCSLLGDSSYFFVYAVCRNGPFLVRRSLKRPLRSPRLKRRLLKPSETRFAFSSVLCLSKSQDCKVTTHVEDIRHNARIIDELDVTLGFANLAAEMNFCRPTMTDEYA